MERSLSLESLEIPEETDTNSDFEVPETKKSTLNTPLEPFVFFSTRPVTELDAAATTIQKVYKGYRTRRNLEECAVVVEEIWRMALDAAALKKSSSVTFCEEEKHETVINNSKV